MDCLTRPPNSDKMKFKAGYLGFCVVVLALFGSVIAGLVLNVDKVETTTTAYDYVTDITGLFEFTDEPQYIEYAPASNYTGYTNTVNVNTNPTGISFSQTSVANNYRMPLTYTIANTGPSGTLNNSSNYTQALAEMPTFNVFDANRPSAPSGYAVLKSQLVPSKVVSLYDFAVANFGALSNYEKIIIDLTAPPVGYPIVDAFFNTITGALYQKSSYQVRTIEINCADLTYKAYRAGNNMPYSSGSLYNAGLFYGNATQTTTMWNLNDSYDVISNSELTLSWTSTLYYPPTYAYMIPSAGVTLAENPNGGYFSTVWDNDTTTAYDNVKVKIVVELNDTGGLLVDNLIVTRDVFGDFPAVEITLDALTQKAYVRPVVSFTNFVDYVVADGTIREIQTVINDPIDSIAFRPYDDRTPLRWSVSGTTLFMDSYDAVMVDPTIDLTRYWPDMTSYRFWFQSFALVGESVTINGVTYDVDENESITINGITERLRNVYISYDLNDNVTLTFANSNRSFDLGPAVDRIVSFDGIWYFTTGLYEGVESTEENYTWAGVFEGNADTIIILGLGLVVVVGLAFSRAGQKFRLLDKVVIALCVFALVMAIGGFT